MDSLQVQVVSIDATMEIKHVIITVNDNKQYLDYWPICSKCWNQGIGIKPTLLYVGNGSINAIDSSNGEVISVKPTPKYNEMLNVLIARTWWMLKYPKELSIVGDIDLLPLDKNSFRLNLDGNAFTWLYNGRYTADLRYLTCYFACTGETMAKIFDVPLNCNLEEMIDAYINKGMKFWNARRRLTRIKQSMYGLDEVSLTGNVDKLRDEGKLKVDYYPNKPFYRMWRGALFPVRWKQWHAGVPMLDYHSHIPFEVNENMINYICNRQFGWDLPVNGTVLPYKLSPLEVL